MPSRDGTVSSSLFDLSTATTTTALHGEVGPSLIRGVDDAGRGRGLERFGVALSMCCWHDGFANLDLDHGGSSVNLSLLIDMV